MSDCANGDMRDLLPALLHDRLGAAERSAVESHLASCAECRDELALLGELRATLRSAPAVDAGAIVRALPAAGTRVRRPWVQWRAAAAVVAIAIGGTSAALLTHEAAVRPAPAPVVVASATNVPTPAPVAVPVEATTDSAEAPAPRPARVARAASRRELAVAGAVSDLSDRELAKLVNDLETLDALPPATAEVESTSLAPAGVPVRGAS